MLTGGGAVALLASPALATPEAETTAPAADPVVAAQSTTTLPLFGTQLTVDVSTTPSGALAEVAVNPADGLTATKVHPNRVTFVNDEGTGKVRVVTRHGATKTGVVAGSLDDIVGAGGWSGDIFGTPTTVSFSIAAAADGTPDITDIVTDNPDGVVGDVQHAGSDHGAVARATVTFTSGIESRRLNITAMVFTKGDITRAASQVSLSKVSGVTLPADQAAGDHTWTGMLCDGTQASVAYRVAVDGTITAGAVTPATANADVDGKSLKVIFSDSESVRIRVGEKDGQLRISANPRLRCDRTTPTVNTPTSPDATDNDHHDGPGWGDRGGERGDRDGRRRGSH